MIRVEVINEDFTLKRFDELKNIVRKGRNEKGKLFIGDTFECTEEMADYLDGNNALEKCFIKVIEVTPKEETKPKTRKKKSKE